MREYKGTVRHVVGRSLCTAAVVFRTPGIGVNDFPTGRAEGNQAQ